jgi:hypothetical protein
MLVYELASCLKEAARTQICQSDAAIPDRLAPLLATNRLALATVIMFALQKRRCTSSRPPHTGVTEPFLVPFSDSLPVSKHLIIVYIDKEEDLSATLRQVATLCPSV